MKDQPKPTTGEVCGFTGNTIPNTEAEWNPEWIRKQFGRRSGILKIKQICDAHNAALAAERGKHRPSEIAGIKVRWDDQPKPTGEWTLDDVVALPWQEICDRHNAALAAERLRGECADVTLIGKAEEEARQLREKLAAEREKRWTPTETANDLWREKAIELEKQLAAAVEALKYIAEGEHSDEAPENARAALAKIGGK